MAKKPVPMPPMKGGMGGPMMPPKKGKRGC